MTESQILNLIREQYGSMLVAAAAQFRHRPEVLAGIMARETEGGTSRLLSCPGCDGKGDPEIKTMPDGSKVKIYHAHGLMQIDDRSFPEFCASADWKDPYKNISFGAEVLRNKRRYISGKALAYHLTDGELERAAIAAYNAGEGRIVRMIELHQDVDMPTAHGNYSADVLRLAEEYRMFSEIALDDRTLP